VFSIAADTAFFGEPVEAYFDDRRLFCDAFYAYYTDWEPEHGWIATAREPGGGEDEMVGFLMGCVDSSRHRRILGGNILPGVVKRVLAGRYHLGRCTWRYLTGLGLGVLRREFPHTDLRRYPAHLHINLLPASRGFSLGRRLLEAYLNQLRELGLPGVHLNTTSQNVAACHLYERMGFRTLDARPNRLWRRFFDHPVENRLYGLEL
jgi:ribosomal protein S18 acetylase RimI-like enzyme